MGLFLLQGGCAQLLGLDDNYAVIKGTGGDLSSGAGGTASGGIGGSGAGGDAGGAPTMPDEPTCENQSSPARFNWVATASASSEYQGPGEAIDGNFETEWTSGAPRTDNDWIEIDLGESVTINRVSVTQAGSDWAEGYQIIFSDEPNPTSPVIAEGDNPLPPDLEGKVIEVTLETPVVGRYLRVRSVVENANWWRVAEIEIGCDESAN